MIQVQYRESNIDKNKKHGEYKRKGQVSLWFRFMVFDATVDNISAMLLRQFYWGSKPDYSEKTTDTLYHIRLYRVNLTMLGST